MEEDLAENQRKHEDGFKKRYKAKLKEASCKNVSPKKMLANKIRGRRMLLGQKLNIFVQKF